MKDGRKFSITRRTSCSSLSRVLSTRSSCSISPASPTSLSQDYKSVCYRPSHRTTNKHRETRYRLNCREDRCNRKRIHTHFLKDRNCEMQDPCLHLRISFALTLHLSHTHLLPRSLHQEQPLRSSCRSTNTALLRQMRSLALWPRQPLPQILRWNAGLERGEVTNRVVGSFQVIRKSCCATVSPGR